MKVKRQLALHASATSHEGHGPDPAEIAKQIRAIAEKGTVDHLLIECDPETPAMAYASLFLAYEDTVPPLSEIAQLTATVLAITPAALLDAFVHRRATAQGASSCFIAEQLEFVSNIVLEGAHDDPCFNLARGIALTLNPNAQVSESAEILLERFLVDAGASFDFGEALDAAGWRKLVDADKPGPGGQDNVTSFAYRARRPFHPRRFWALLQEELPGIFRAKGFFWLATRMDQVGGINLAGSELHCAPAGTWWAARDDRARQFDMPERTRKEWKEPFGDRRQAIAFMGIDFDVTAFKAQLDACLLTDAEMAAGEESWPAFTDPFPAWSTHPHEHEHACGHDHGPDEHDCCHH